MDIIDKIVTFMKAQQEAEKKDLPYFDCPLCGGPASWGRARSNNHLFFRCSRCGFRMME